MDRGGNCDPGTLTLPQAAKRLGVSYQTLWRAAKAKGEVLPGVKVFRIGSTLRVSTSQLEEFLRTGQVSSTAAE